MARPEPELSLRGGRYEFIPESKVLFSLGFSPRVDPEDSGAVAYVGE